MQDRPRRVDTEIQVAGRVTDVEEVPRGQAVTSEVEFTGPGGSISLTAKRRSLRPDPSRVDARGAGKRPSPVVEDPSVLRYVGDVEMTPDRVTGYRSTGNPNVP